MKNENCDTESGEMCSYINLLLLQVKSKTNPYVNNINQLLLKEICGTNYSTIEEYLASINHQDTTFAHQEETFFSVQNVENGILSLSIFFDSYDEGAAHGVHYLMYKNYCLETGREIKLDDLLSFNYSSKLYPIAKRKFIEQNGNDWEIRPDNFTFDNFLILKEGIIFEYHIYQLGPYVKGSASVFIPYEEIMILLNKNGILARVLNK